MYRWRSLSDAEQKALLRWRKDRLLPLHSPPHGAGEGACLLTASCYEHQPVIGYTADRLRDFSAALIESLLSTCERVHAWVVLPHHYHVLLTTLELKRTLSNLGRFHGRTSFQWNGEEAKLGRQVWCNTVDRAMRSEAHFWATMNYIHHNPVRHGYVSKRQDWPFSSAREYLESVGETTAADTWRNFPLKDYGAGWDEPSL
jgi:putative transposase